MNKFPILIICISVHLYPIDTKAESSDNGSKENDGTISLSRKDTDKNSQFWILGPMTRILVIPGKNTALFVELYAEKFFNAYISSYGTLGLGLDISWQHNLPVQQTTDYNGFTHVTYYSQSFYIKIPIGAILALPVLLANGDPGPLFLTDGFSIHFKPLPTIDIAPYAGFFTAIILNPGAQFLVGPEAGLRISFRVSNRTRISGQLGYQYLLDNAIPPHCFQAGLALTWKS